MRLFNENTSMSPHPHYFNPPIIHLLTMKIIPLCRRTAAVIVFSMAAASISCAATLTNGSLTVDIRNDNGAIDTVSFGGTDYFNPGTPVSNWGFQTSTTMSTFVLNSTSGGTGQAVSVSPLGVVTGSYTVAGANLQFTRTYSLVAGTNTLRIDMSYQNLGPTITLRQFETLDPDQGTPLGLGSTTYNDVFSLGGTQIGQARLNGPNTHAVVLGSSATAYSIASGNPFQISSGTDLNNFFASPFDGNDAAADSGLHIGFERTLATGQSGAYSIFLSFGLTASAAQTSYVDAINAVPEPSFIVLSVFGLAPILIRRRR